MGSSSGSSGPNNVPRAMAVAARARLAGKLGSIEWPSAVPVARTGRRSPARNARSSSVGAATPLAPDRTADAPGARCRCMPSSWRRAFRVAAPGLRVQRFEAIAAICAIGVAPRASAWARLSITRKQPSDPNTMPPPFDCRAPTGANGARSSTPPSAYSRMTSGRSALYEPPTSARSPWPAAMRAQAIRTASTPEASSPMKVRDEPATPCTIEMLPASRLDSCARNRVGRKSLVSRSFSSTPGSAACGRAARRASSTARSLSPPPAATIMSIRPSRSALPFTPALSSARPAA